jgi:hypothetical protein
MTSMFPVRRAWDAPTEQELASACAEAAAEAGIAFNAFSLPSVKRLLCVASGGKLVESEVPTPYKIVKALAPMAERRTAEQVTGWTKLARDFTLSACLDGWQSRRGIEMITSAVGGPGAEIPHFIGFTALRGKVSWDRVKQMHELSVSEVVSPKSVGLIVHDEGSNILKAANSLAEDEQKKGNPVFSFDCALHLLHTITRKITKILCEKDLKFSGRVAASISRCRRVRDLYASTVKDRVRRVLQPDHTERTIPDRSAPPLLGKTRCLCIPDNLDAVASRRDVWKIIASDSEVGPTFRNFVLKGKVKYPDSAR